MFNLSGIFRDVVIYSVPAPVSKDHEPALLRLPIDDAAEIDTTAR